MTDVNGQMIPISYKVEITGYLGHDNKLFDRTCTNCGGMYSSYEVSACPKCGSQLTNITSGSGKAMAISEGTIYPAFGPKQKKRDADSVNNRKNGMPCVYRFKLFSFADDNGVLAPPANHHLLKSGSRVKITMVNHEMIHSWFLNKEEKPNVEVMLMIYPQYGDRVEYLDPPKANQLTTAMAVDASGNIAPVDTGSLEERIAILTREIEALKASKAPVQAEDNAEMAYESTTRGKAGPFDAAS